MAVGAHMRRGRSALLSRLPLLSLCVFVLFFFGLPVVMLVRGAFRTSAPGFPGDWTLDPVVSVFSNGQTWETLRNSVALSAAQHSVGIALALFFAWVVARTNAPLRRLVTPMMVVLFAVPGLFVAISYGLLAGSPNGLINRGLVGILGGDPRVVLDVYSWWGLIFVSIVKTVPVMYLLLLGPVMALNRALEEASVMAGASRTRTFFRIQVTVLAPVLTGLAVLGFVVGLGLLDTPLILGVPAGIYVFPSRIYDYLAGGTGVQYAEASALSLLLVVLILGLVALRARALRGREFTTVTGKAYSTHRWDLGRAKWLCTAAIVVFGVVALVLPVAQLVLGSLQPIFGVGLALTLDNYRDLLADPTVGEAVFNTVVVGAVGGFIATTLALVIAYTSRRSTSRLRHIPEWCIWILLAFPGIVLGLGMVWAYLSLPGLNAIYGSVWIVIIALVVFISPTAVRSIDGAVAQIDRELEESSRMSGASATRTVLAVVARLIAPSFFATWFVAGVAIAGNLDVSLLLSGPGNRTVPVLTYNYYSQNAQTAQAAALLCLLMGIVAAVFVVGRVLVAVLRRLLARRRPEPSDTSPGLPTGDVVDAPPPSLVLTGHAAPSGNGSDQASGRG